MNEKYRIVTNGFQYRIEIFIPYPFPLPFCSKGCWRFRKGNFKTMEDAQECLNDIKRCCRASDFSQSQIVYQDP